MRASSLAIAALAALLGCGHTRVVASERDARIYVDGRLEGRGSAEVRRYGLPGTAHVVARAPDGRRERAELSRGFHVGTFLLGFVTYGVCWVACWSYPDAVRIELPPAAKAGWDERSDDPWMQGSVAPAPAPPPPAGRGW